MRHDEGEEAEEQRWQNKEIDDMAVQPRDVARRRHVPESLELRMARWEPFRAVGFRDPFWVIKVEERILCIESDPSFHDELSVTRPWPCGMLFINWGHPLNRRRLSQ